MTIAAPADHAAINRQICGPPNRSVTATELTIAAFVVEALSARNDPRRDAVRTAWPKHRAKLQMLVLHEELQRVEIKFSDVTINVSVVYGGLLEDDLDLLVIETLPSVDAAGEVTIRIYTRTAPVELLWGNDETSPVGDIDIEVDDLFDDDLDIEITL